MGRILAVQDRAVRLQLPAHVVVHMIQIDSNTFAPGKSKCRHQIAISSRHNDCVYKTFKRKASDI